MFKKLLGKIQNPKVTLAILLVVSLAVSLQCYFVKPDPNSAPNHELTLYSNYLIFKNSFFHLIHHQNLYLIYPDERIDYFKYSPAFALLMAPMALLPDFAGMLVWNLLNIVVLFFAFRQLPIHQKSKLPVALLFILIEAITAMGNCQSNSLVAGLIILTFLFLHKNNMAMATLMVVLAVYIKLFGLVAFVLFLLYPNKLKAFFYTVIWFLVFAVLPVVVVPFSELILIYKNWWDLLSQDYANLYALSVMGLFSSWFGFWVNDYKQIFTVVGLIFFCIPMVRYKQFGSQKFRLFFLASVLLWVVLFNHRAESPTYVIAVSGVAIWFLSQKYNLFNFILIVFAIFFTVMSATDIIPAFIRHEILVPYRLKVLPCLLIWLKLIYDMLSQPFEKNSFDSIE